MKSDFYPGQHPPSELAGEYHQPEMNMDQEGKPFRCSPTGNKEQISQKEQDQRSRKPALSDSIHAIQKKNSQEKAEYDNSGITIIGKYF